MNTLEGQFAPDTLHVTAVQSNHAIHTRIEHLMELVPDTFSLVSVDLPPEVKEVADLQYMAELPDGIEDYVSREHLRAPAVTIEMDSFPRGSTRYNDIMCWILGLTPPAQQRLDIDI